MTSTDNAPAQSAIRMASARDAADLARAHVESWRETYPGLIPAAMLSSLSVDARTAKWARTLGRASAAAAVFVAESAGRIVGFGSCGRQRTEALRARGYDGEIEAIYVLKAFQRQGLGTRLLFTMASSLEASGFTSASLWVLRGNAPARRFYERCGGRLIAEREDVRAEGILFEVAYGWAELSDLLRLTGAAPGG